MKKRKVLPLLMAGILATATALPVSAATTEEQIADARAQKQSAESSLSATQEHISSLESQKRELESYLNELNTQYTNLTKEVGELSEKAALKQEELQNVQKELEEAKEEQAKQYEDMKLRIAYMYENGTTSYINLLCEANSFGEFLSRAENISQITKYDREMLKKYEATSEKIAEQETKVEQEAEEINNLRAENAAKRQEVKELAASTSDNVLAYAEEISSNYAQAQSLVSQVNSANDSLYGLMQQAAEERRAAQEAEEQAAAEQAALEEQEASQETEEAEEVSYEEESTESSEETESQDETYTDEGESEETAEEDYSEETEEVQEESGDSAQDNSSDENVSDESAGSSEDTYEEESSSGSSSSQGTYLGNFKLTAYCNCAQCCGTAGNQTASGTWPQAGRTVAMAGVPFGTQLLINGNVYTVEDLGTPYGHVDIYFNSHSEALAFGLQYADVYQL